MIIIIIIWLKAVLHRAITQITRIQRWKIRGGGGGGVTSFSVTTLSTEAFSLPRVEGRVPDMSAKSERQTQQH
jgi:hypothetical protein